jgi:hypothetical protein
MKKINRLVTIPLLIVFVIFGLITLKSCSKDETKTDTQINSENTGINKFSSVDEKLTYYFGELSKKQQKSIFQNIWKWLVAHAGTNMFGNICHMNLPCGDCPGICIPLSKSTSEIFYSVPEDYQLTQQEYTDGCRLLQMALLNDSIMAMTLVNDDLVYQDTVYIFRDVFIGDLASTTFQKDSVILLQGHYPVSYTHSKNGTTVVDVRTYNH